MDREVLRKLSEETGFVKTAVMETADLEFHPEYRAFCEANACGNYDRNYGCPPDCGTPEEMEQKVMAYRKALVFQSQGQVKDIFDGEETKKLKQAHSRMTRQLLRRLSEAGVEMDGFPIMCGPCGYCKTCGKVTGEACMQEEMRASCLSAYCIDASSMAAKCGMDIQWTGDVVSFFSLYVFGRK